MAFAATVHVQTTIGPEHLATIAQGLMTLGRAPRSMSELVAMALEMFADILVENGHHAVVEPQVIEEVLDSIGRGRRRQPKLTFLSPQSARKDEVNPFGTVVARQAKEIHASGRYRQRERGSRDEIEVLPSVADDGEFSADVLRKESE